MIVETDEYIYDIRMHDNGKKYIVPYFKKPNDTVECFDKQKKMMDLSHKILARSFLISENAPASH